MSTEIIDLVRDTTMQDIAYSLRTLANINAGELADMAAIRKLVRTGNAARVFAIGDQINVPWTDKATGEQYVVPMDVVHHGEATLKDGTVVPAMYLQWHYATPFGVQFNNYQAFYYCEEELPAGTYYVTMGYSWGNNVVANKSYNFTLTQAVPAGGQLAGFRGAPDNAATSWKVYAFANKTTAEAQETVSVSEGVAGTFLGTFTAAGDGNINSLQSTAYGYNRWGQSAMRQWLNSAADAGAWWAPQNNYDRPADQLATKAGFLSGFEQDFLDCLTPIKVTTALNTVTDAADGTTEDTYDKIFLPSLEQIYTTPQLAGVEGEYWDYWKRALGRTTPTSWHPNVYPEYITYALENKTSPQHVRLRSATRGTSCIPWNVYAGGYVNYYGYYAIYACRCAPACAIC